MRLPEKVWWTLNRLDAIPAERSDAGRWAGGSFKARGMLKAIEITERRAGKAAK